MKEKVRMPIHDAKLGAQRVDNRACAQRYVAINRNNVGKLIHRCEMQQQLLINTLCGRQIAKRDINDLICGPQTRTDRKDEREREGRRCCEAMCKAVVV